MTMYTPNIEFTPAPTQSISCGMEDGGVTLHIPLNPDYADSTVNQTLKAALVAAEYIELFARKQESYGSGNINSFGELGVLIRASDKIERLKQLVMNKKTNDLETVADTWTDLLGYGIIGLLVHRGQW